MNDNYYLIKYKYDMGGYSLDEMIELVEKNVLTEDDFHSITSKNYSGVKESRTE